MSPFTSLFSVYSCLAPPQLKCVYRLLSVHMYSPGSMAWRLTDREPFAHWSWMNVTVWGSMPSDLLHIAGIPAGENAEILLVATISSLLSIQPALQRPLVCAHLHFSQFRAPWNSSRQHLAHMEEPGIIEAGTRHDLLPMHPTHTFLGEALHKRGCFTHFLNGANAFRPLPLLRKQSVGTASLWF